MFVAVFAVLFMAVWFYLSVTQPANAGGTSGPAQAAYAPMFDTGDLTVRTPAGTEHRFQVELALTPEQRRFGLMFRERLDADAGMLFVYDPPRPVAMWMKNTLIPLDMLFADRNGRVFYVHENARPHDESLIYPPDQNAQATYVLELPAGTVRALGLGAGDTLVR